MRIEEKDGNLVVSDFNNLEAYKIACRIEKDGMEFYGELAVKAKNKKQKEIFDFLLSKEKEHLKFFEEALSGLRESEEDAFEEDDLLQYMDYGIFSRPSEFAETSQDIEKAINAAIGMEEKSKQFYEACQQNTQDKKTAGELKKIAKEEVKHKKLLEDILQYHMF
jgi:rubrerythrin